jgi:hypothetical protein
MAPVGVGSKRINADSNIRRPGRIRQQGASDRNTIRAARIGRQHAPKRDVAAAGGKPR